MSKNLLILLTAVIYYTGCSKNGNNPVVPPTSTPGISIQSITTPAFVNSTWSNVLGGTASIEFDLLNANDSVTNKVSDNVDLNNLNGYFKSLNKGTYNIMASYQNNMVADTFLRFNALVNADNVTTKQNLTLPATSTDGLISIAKTYIKDGTIPVFTPEAGGKTFKLGYINGYYYLYIQGGTTGSISFVSIATGQNVTKNLDIVTLNQYNMGVKVNNGVLQVTFVPFVKNSVDVNTATLLTLNINASAYSINKSVYFVVTDENGNVLNAVKYIPGTTTFKIASNQPFNEDRFNFFEINISALANTAPNILGFLQVKKGSIFTSNPSFPPQKPSKPVNLHFSNAPNFDQLNVSTEITGGYPITSLADTISIAQANVPTAGKLWVQMLRNNQYSYNFLPISANATDYNIDFSQLTETPLAETITSPGNNLQVDVFAKPDTNYSDTYNFGMTRSQSNLLVYYYPVEKFPEYDVLEFYSINNLNYLVSTAGPSIPAQAASFNASFSLQGSTLADFVPSCSGDFDFYHANFLATAPYLEVDLYSPSAANYYNIKLPDFSPYLNVASIDLTGLKLKEFDLNQMNGFNEKNFYYSNFVSSTTMNYKYVEQVLP